MSKKFQHTAARRRLVSCRYRNDHECSVSTHSRPKAAGAFFTFWAVCQVVSTHSRLKAAGPRSFPIKTQSRRFNTQPPEGGWNAPRHFAAHSRSFNTQPPEGGWVRLGLPLTDVPVSTHSRLKAAGRLKSPIPYGNLGFNTQPPEGGWADIQSLTRAKIMFQHTAA